MTDILNNTKYVKTILDDSKLSLTVEITLELFNNFKEQILLESQRDLTLDGFRKGQVPLKKVEESLGTRLYEDVLNRLLPQITSEIVIKEGLKPISQVKYDVKSLSPMTSTDKPAVVFSVEFVNLPIIKLPDFKEIKIEEKVDSVTEDEIDKYIAEIKKRNNESEDKSQISEVPDHEEVRRRLESSNQYVAEQDFRNKLLKEILSKSNINLPLDVYEEEASIRYTDYTKRITDLGLKLDDFLKMQNTSEEDLKKRFNQEAKDSINISMILSQVILDYKLDVSEDEIKAEIDMIDDITTKDQYSTPEARERIRLVMLQQKALEKLVSLVRS